MEEEAAVSAPTTEQEEEEDLPQQQQQRDADADAGADADADTAAPAAPPSSSSSPLALPPPPPPSLLSEPSFSQPLPPGPPSHLLHGTFPQGHQLAGMQFFVRGCAKPRRRAALSLAVRVGSVLERDDERGLAHVLEHLAFSGTEKFRRHALVDFLESIGAEFGACSNAHTSADETVYELLVPLEREGEEEEEEEEESESDDSGGESGGSAGSGDDEGEEEEQQQQDRERGDDASAPLPPLPPALDQALAILAQFAFAVRCDPADLERERGPVLDELRGTKDAGGRQAEAHFVQLTKPLRYSERLPIGLESVVRTAPAERVREFYRRWYRPDAMVVVVAGDFGGGKQRGRKRRGKNNKGGGSSGDNDGGESGERDAFGAPDFRVLRAVAAAIELHFSEAHSAAVAGGHLPATPSPPPDPPAGPLPLRLPAGGPLDPAALDEPATAEAAIKNAREAAAAALLAATSSSPSPPLSWPPPRCAAYHDREAASSAAYAAFVSSAIPLDSPRALRLRLCDDLLSVALSSRLFKLSRRGDGGQAPFFGADASASPEPLCAAAECRVLSAASRDGRTLESLELLLEECARVRLHGLSERELGDARADLLAENETTFLERHQGHAADYRDELVRHALWREFAVGQGLEARLTAALLPTITAEEVARRAWLLHPAFAPGGVCLKTVDGAGRKAGHSAQDMQRALERVLVREAKGEVGPWREREEEDDEEGEEGGDDDDDNDDEAGTEDQQGDALALALAAASQQQQQQQPPAAAASGPPLLDPEPEPPSMAPAEAGGLLPAFVARCRPLSGPCSSSSSSSSSRIFPKGSVEWTLQNGVRVAFVPTPWADDEVLMSAVAVGGLSDAIAEDERRQQKAPPPREAEGKAAGASPSPLSSSPPPGGAFSSARLAANLASALGCWGHSPETLHDLLAGKRLSVDVAVGAYSRSFGGSASPADLADAFRLAHALLTRPTAAPGQEVAEEEGAGAAAGGNASNSNANNRRAAAALASALAQLRQSIAARRRDPASRWRDAVRRATYGADCPFFTPLGEADVDAAEKDGAREAVRRFNALFSGSAAHFCFVIVGAVPSAERLLPLVGRYLATLPPAAAAAADGGPPPPPRPDARRIAPLRFAFPPGPPPVRVDVPCRMSHSLLRSSAAQITWPVALPRPTAREGIVWLQLAARVFEARLLRSMRFEMGETYGVSVSTFYGLEAPSSPGDRPVRGEMSVTFTCEPGAREKLLALAVRTLGALQGGGGSEGDDGNEEENDDRPPTQQEVATALRLERLSWEESQETNSFWHDVLSTAYQSRQYSETEEQGGGRPGDGDLVAVHLRTVAARKTVRKQAAADPLALRRALRELLPCPCDERYAAVAMVPKRAWWWGGGGGGGTGAGAPPSSSSSRRLVWLAAGAAVAGVVGLGAWAWFGPRTGGGGGREGERASASKARV